jgi:nicotinamidase-related amidase
MTDLEDVALLPIDVQRGFDDPSWPQRWNEEMEANGRALLAHWRAAGAPVIHVRHDSVQPGSTLAPGHWGNAFRDGFAPIGDEPVVSKSVNSAFIGTDLDLRLRRLGIKRIVTFGISTDMCVSTTIRTGANMGWAFTLVADACDCFDLPGLDGATIPARAIQDAHVATLAMEFCEVTTTARMIGPN